MRDGVMSMKTALCRSEFQFGERKLKTGCACLYGTVPDKERRDDHEDMEITNDEGGCITRMVAPPHLQRLRHELYYFATLSMPFPGEGCQQGHRAF
jgi:hypothetical protein